MTNESNPTPRGSGGNEANPPLNSSAKGLQWVKQGFLLFRQQPTEIMALFFAYMFTSLGLSLVPLVGQVLPLLLIPTLMMGFMQACRRVQNGEKVTIGVLFEGFRSPAFSRLLWLGVFYVLMAVLVIAASSLVDGGMFWNVMVLQKEVDEAVIRNSDMLSGALLAALAYMPALMAFWYAGALIMWNGMSVSKALFYSFFAVKRAAYAFIAYGAAWLLIGVVAPTFVAMLIGAIVGNVVAVMIVVLPISLALTAVMYCSFYPTYVDVFGKPDFTVTISETE
jgi:hypothetical protein